MASKFSMYITLLPTSDNMQWERNRGSNFIIVVVLLICSANKFFFF